MKSIFANSRIYYPSKKYIAFLIFKQFLKISHIFIKNISTSLLLISLNGVLCEIKFKLNR